jgi:hypothetical protein
MNVGKRSLNSTEEFKPLILSDLQNKLDEKIWKLTCLLTLNFAVLSYFRRKKGIAIAFAGTTTFHQ